jgi:hypothetical protein
METIMFISKQIGYKSEIQTTNFNENGTYEIDIIS